MSNTMTTFPKSPLTDADDKRPPTSGETHTSRDPRVSPRLPHEGDESAGSQTAENPSQRQIGKQALEDLENGLEDTGRKPALDQVYDENLRGDGTGTNDRPGATGESSAEPPEGERAVGREWEARPGAPQNKARGR
jgi:hypothetical protein